ncbi:MAG: hypothetical protein PHW87_07790 [Methanothrix sp.]|nr:hypothetical protein [Methanothrix sp.]
MLPKTQRQENCLYQGPALPDIRPDRSPCPRARACTRACEPAWRITVYEPDPSEWDPECRKRI